MDLQFFISTFTDLELYILTRILVVVDVLIGRVGIHY
jgi:hypothetical protein